MPLYYAQKTCVGYLRKQKSDNLIVLVIKRALVFKKEMTFVKKDKPNQENEVHKKINYGHS